MRSQKIRKRDRREKNVEGKKMGTDDAVFRVDLLLLPR
jgi:hypothetical protein